MKNAIDVLRDLIGHLDRKDLIPNPATMGGVEDRILLVQTLVWARIVLEADASRSDLTEDI